MTDDAKMPTKAQAEVLALMAVRPNSGLPSDDADRSSRSICTNMAWLGWVKTFRRCGFLGRADYITPAGRRALSLYESKHGPINKEHHHEQRQ